MSAKQDIHQSIQLALQHHQSGELQQAEQIYHDIIAIDSENVDANHFLGVIAHQSGHHHQAIQLIHKAIASNPNLAAIHNNQGEAFRSLNRLDEAVACYERALSLDPDLAEVHNNHGDALYRLGRTELAAASFKKATEINPNHAQAHTNLGNALLHLGRTKEAVSCFKKAISIKPDSAEAFNNLGFALKSSGQIDEAIENYKKAIANSPNYVEAFNNLGIAFTSAGQLSRAITCYQKALTIQPEHAWVHNNLGAVLKEQGLMDDALCSYQKAIAIKPDFAEAHNNLGIVHQILRSMDKAVDCFRKALDISPDYAEVHSNLLFSFNYNPGVSAEDIFAEYRRWNDRHAKPLLPITPTYKNVRDGERKLNVGYISPDFHTHPVAYFFEPLLKKHDRARVEVYCYSNVVKPDAVTQRLQEISDHWCSIVGMSDQSTADQIRHDEIDILVDLAGHTKNNKLLVLARKPAPLQVTWLGYPNTTGLEAIDYRFTDEIADPVGLADKLHSEELIRLKNGFLCYQGMDSTSVKSTLPSSERGYITFASFNNLTKVVPEVVSVWIEILRAIPAARLLLKSKQLADKEVQQRYLAMFKEGQIDHDRIEFHGHLPSVKDHLQLYGKVDIGLDPFPYNGTTTTCEALWMGVPVITLMGDRHSGRVGASILTQVGLADLIAEDAKSYIDLAVGLAEDTDKLASLRRSLRGMMIQSELCNAVSFARKVEDAYAVMWNKYLTNSPS